MGLDPGLRTGVKVAVVDATGKVVATDTIYPHEPRRAWDAALATLTKLAVAHDVELVAIGNGTASRETDKLARELAATQPGAQADHGHGQRGGRIGVLRVGLRLGRAARAGRVAARCGVHRPPAAGPAGRAGEDRPQVDRGRPVPARPGRVGAVALAGRGRRGLRERGRRGRQHRVGAAAAPGLRDHRGAGRRRSWRTATPTGPFRTRTALAEVPRLGPKAFEQCAGFLRIRGGDDPLDVSGVHPESYPVVHRILAAAKTDDIATLIGNGPKLKSLRPRDFVDERFGLPTVTDILAELEKPGRDPRPVFRTATFAEGVHKISDLRPGMLLEGAGHQRGRVRRVRRRRRAPGRAGARLGHVAPASSPTRARWSSPATWCGSRCSRSTRRASASRSPCGWTTSRAPGAGAVATRFHPAGRGSAANVEADRVISPTPAAAARSGAVVPAATGAAARPAVAARAVGGRAGRSWWAGRPSRSGRPRSGRPRQQGGRGGRGGDRRAAAPGGGGRSGADRSGGTGGGLGNSAMADALRRAGLTGDDKERKH